VHDSFQWIIDTQLDAFRIWCLDKSINTCRLVHFCGVDLLGATGISMTDIESKIIGLLCDGFYVSWAEKDGCLYLRVWEFGGPVPEWSLVFAELPLADIESVCRLANEL
jgi:hypothetical protein